jgi:tetratricopeptide (TPR) repeat protein
MDQQAMMDPSNPFGAMMQQAVKMKGAKQAELRTDFDGWPKYYQNSMFAKDEVLEARAADFDTRLEKANELKEQANEKFRKWDYFNACMAYEVALSVFKFITNKNPNWRNQGIKDEDLISHDFKSEDPDEVRQANEFKVACYNNIAACQLKLKDWPTVISATTDAVSIDDFNAKALYRRSRALTLPKSCGAVERDMAIKDLEKAHIADPDDSKIKAELHKWKAERSKQKKNDKATFTGMFGRGEVYNPDEIVEEKKKQVVEDEKNEEAAAKKQVDDIEFLIQKYEMEGKHEEAKGVRLEMETAREKARKEALRKRMDFKNPTPEMIEEAKGKGIDLTDPQVQQMLIDMAHEGEEGEGGGGNATSEGSGGGGGGGEKKSAKKTKEETRAVVMGMEKKDLVGFLAQDMMLGKKFTKEQLEAMTLELLQRRAMEEIETSAMHPQNQLVKPITYAIMAVLVSYRLYTLGVFGTIGKMLMGGDAANDSEHADEF